MRFSAAEETFLICNMASVESYQELTDKLNARFKTDRKRDSVREKCTKGLKIKLGKNPTCYGRKKKEQLPVGTVRRSAVGTYIKVLECDHRTKFSGYKEPWWTPLQKKVYIDHYGDVPDGYMVCFLNGDKEDYRPKNLYPITRKTSAVLSSRGWWSKNADITLTAIKLIELEESIRSVMKGERNELGH